MKNIVGLTLISLSVFSSSLSLGAKEPRLDPQADYERSVEAVVRNKMYYKSGKFEVAGMGGVMPYDNINNHYLIGGRLTWHLSDHFGWEVADFQFGMPSLTSYAKGLVQEKGISNLQTSQIKYAVTSNFLVSPFYGKIRIFGSSLVYLDTYLVAGGGMANTETVRLASTAQGVAGIESTIRSGMEPVFDFGIGFKVFLNPFMGFIVDLRDYVVLSEVYGSRNAKSNYTVSVGLNFFLPHF